MAISAALSRMRMLRPTDADQHHAEAGGQHMAGADAAVDTLASQHEIEHREDREVDPPEGSLLIPCLGVG